MSIALHRVSPDFHYEPPKWLEASRRENKFSEFPFLVRNNFEHFRTDNKLDDSETDGNVLQPLPGFRIIIHNSDEFPFRNGQQLQYTKRVTLRLDFSLAINEVDKALQSWPPERRSCFMPNEKRLRLFKMYSKANCEQECLSDEILKACGCVPFNIIR